MKYFNRSVWSWAWYDWANSAFATTVMAGFFPIFFKNYWSAGTAVTESTWYLGVANSCAGIIVVLLAPMLGAIADRGGAQKKFLGLFAVLGTTMTAALYFVAQGQWGLAAACYIGATLGFLGGNIFYDALLVSVARPQEREMVSSLGFALGYLGGGLLFALNVLMTLQPAWFGLTDAAQAVRLSFISVAVWWLLFSLPLFLWVGERHAAPPVAVLTAVRQGLGQLAATMRSLRHYRQVMLFLVAYWLYIDGVDTIVLMAVDYGLSLGFQASDLITALLITQFVGFPAALLFGRLGSRLGARTGIYLALLVYIAVTLIAYGIHELRQFYLLAVMIGLVQGGVQALSRAFYSRLIPQDKAAEFFGFYNMMGKFAVVLGPLLMGWAARASGDPRSGILVIIVLFIAGGLLLFRVREPAAMRSHTAG